MVRTWEIYRGGEKEYEVVFYKDFREEGKNLFLKYLCALDRKLSLVDLECGSYIEISWFCKLKNIKRIYCIDLNEKFLELCKEKL